MPIAGTATRYHMNGLREDLSDVIYNISPEDTPFMSSAGKGPAAKQTLVEWQTDALAAPSTANAHVEGADATFEVPAATVRVGNHTQISRKTLILSETLEVVDKAGRRSELAYQIAKRGAELKRDQESTLLANQGAVSGSASVARRLASLGAWIKTNVNLGGTGANPAYVSGVPTGARTDGTQRAFSETILKDVIQKVWTQGGNPRVLMVGPVNKTKVSAFSGIATRNFDLSNVSPKPTAIIASADVYVSDFGTLRVVPNRFQRERDGWVLDFDLVDLSYLRPHKTEKLAKTGDAEKRMLICEYTLRVKQEAGLGLCADLTTT
jgi:hypothetical protein